MVLARFSSNLSQKVKVMKKKSLILLFCVVAVLSCFNVKAENIDSLERLLSDATGAKRATILNKLSYEYRSTTAKSAEYANEALLYARGAKDINQEIEALQNLANAIRKSEPDKAIDHALSALAKSKQIQSKKDEAKSLFYLSKCYISSDSAKCANYAFQGLSIAEAIEDNETQLLILQQIVFFYFNKGAYTKAIEFKLKRIAINERLKDKIGLADDYLGIGILYKTLGEYPKAIDFYQKCEKLQKQLNDVKGRAQTLSNLGIIFFYMEKWDMALSYYTEGLKLYEQSKDPVSKGFVANTLNSIGLVFKNKKDYKSSLEYYKKALAIYTELKINEGLAATKNNLSEVLLVQKNYPEAEKFCLDALRLNNESQQIKGTLGSMLILGEIYYNWNKPQKALEYYEKALRNIEDKDLTREYQEVYSKIAQSYASTGNFQKAYTYFHRFTSLKDSTLNAENSKQLNELGKKFETEKKDLQLKASEANAEKQKQRLFFSIFGIFALFIVIFLIYARYRLKNRANKELSVRNAQISQANEEIQAQRDEIGHQRDVLIKQKQEITDSIHYASRIQQVILPPLELIGQSLSDYFVFYKPRDIVSGDYYWFHQKGGKVIITAADCTGHGVPGAFMSMLGISFLNEISNKTDKIVASEILNQLKEYVITSLRQTGKENEQKDGMDIALVVLDLEQMKAQYAGAYNSMYLIRDKQLIEYKADKMPIGIYFRGDKKFTNNEFDLMPGDRIYICSDGYADQFGGPHGRKFMSQNLKKLLLDIHEKPMPEQREILDQTNLEWRGTEQEQVDDILVIGFKI
jgi:serine phosphatase RsbU (regulator of sigma subunit)/TPR repeat protein